MILPFILFQFPFPFISRPIRLQNNFIFPDTSGLTERSTPEIASKDMIISEESTVRIAASFDMGWTTRGTGRNYDSLTGLAALIGFFNKKVLAYVSKNRKCRMCDSGHAPEDHDCRRNFEGFAKAMEPKSAAELANNEIFNVCHVQLGIIISDNDSSSLSAVRAATNHEVIKHAHKNHTRKGVTNELYKIKKDHKELNAISIKHLPRCFNYSVSQNTGNVAEMSAAIKNVPYHCFNIHTDCGAWCGYKKNPETYKHSTIGEGFQDERLFSALKCLFNVLASKTDKFVAGVSSNVNESLNTIIASKAPKSRLYGMSASGDYRVACAINKKNDGKRIHRYFSVKIILNPWSVYHETRICKGL